jgi:hypothetical protein
MNAQWVLPLTESRLRRLAGVLAAPLVAMIPFLKGALGSRAFYFRDLSVYFFPVRRFVVEGLRRGELRYWNPFVQEGIPVTLPPLGYPPDFLQMLLPDERGFSLLLALHIPLAAVAFSILSRDLKLSSLAATGGALVYALGGFALSCLNLYVYVAALAWAPLVIWALRRAAVGGRREAAVAGCLVALDLSTTGIEVVVQTLVIALLLLPARSRRLRVLAPVALGVGLAAPVLLVIRGMVAGTARGQGLATELVLAHSVHPVTFLQVLVGGLYGDLNNLGASWWGDNFFPRGFPYFLSLYLGLAVVTLAAVGVAAGGALRWRIVLLVLFGGWFSLGRWGGFGPLVDLVPFLHALRYPSKAFFSVHFGVALLVAEGLHALGQDAARRAWRALAAFGLGLGLAFGIAQTMPALAPGTTRWLLLGFFPPRLPWAARESLAGHVLQDAAIGGGMAVLAGLLGCSVLKGWFRPGLARGLLVALVAADLLREGAGLNPMVTHSLYTLSPETAELAAQLRPGGGRVFTCRLDSSPTYLRARPFFGEAQDAWTFGLLNDTLSPFFNMGPEIPSALSLDTTMLVGVERVTTPDEAGCETVSSLIPRLRSAGVTQVVSVDALDDAALRERAVLAPRRAAPLTIKVYDLDRPLPLRFVAAIARPARDRAEGEALAREPGFQERGGSAVEGLPVGVSGARGEVLKVREAADRIELEVEADGRSVVVLRQGYAAGWSAHVDTRPALLLRADGRHCAIPIEAGRHRVLLSYSPPGLVPGIGLGLASALVLGVAFAWPARRRRDSAS